MGWAILYPNANCVDSDGNLYVVDSGIIVSKSLIQMEHLLQNGVAKEMEMGNLTYQVELY
jgi:hypothetical protein